MFGRKALGLLWAALIAPSLTVILAVVPLAPGRHEILAAIPLLVIFAVLLGTVGAAIFLGIAFAIAGIGSPSRLRFILAGGGAGLAYALAGPILKGLGASYIWAAVLGLTLSATTGSLGERIHLGIAAIIAGLVAGAAYAAIVLPGQPWPFAAVRQQLRATSARRIAAGASAAVLAVAALFVLMHDFEGERLCDHTNIVRLRFGDAVYYIPAAMQPGVDAVDDAGLDGFNIFKRAGHPGTPAAAAAHYGQTYCQAKNAPAWRVKSFWFGHLPPALAAPGYPGLPEDVRELRLLEATRARAGRLPLPASTRWTGETPWFRIAKQDNGFVFVSKGPLVQGRPVWGRDSLYSQTHGHSNELNAAADASADAEFYVTLDPADPDASLPSIRSVDRLLTWLKTPR